MNICKDCKFYHKPFVLFIGVEPKYTHIAATNIRTDPVSYHVTVKYEQCDIMRTYCGRCLPVGKLFESKK
jgi:hypothetical protein